MFHVPNKYRIRDSIFGSDDSIGNNGCFQFRMYGYSVFCQASDGAGWEHVSVSIDRNRCPGWNIMQEVKNLFWDEEDVVFQFHPPRSQYVNQHPYCLHLWRPENFDIPIPPSILVGITNEALAEGLEEVTRRFAK